jgi:diguanylate cyclase (GGDEF)-like protein
LALEKRLHLVLTMLNSIMGKVSALLRPKMWSLLLVDNTTQNLYFKIVVSPVADKLKEIRLKIGEGVAGWVAESGEPLLINDAQRDDRFARHIDGMVSFTTRSIICVPMKIKNKVIGVIELINSLEDCQYDDADLTLLETIADYAAIAIENAQNFQRVNEMLITDDLTGLYTARHFNEILDRELAAATRYNFPVSLVFFDLDRFKQVNDTHGHLVGSHLLSEVGSLLKRSIRAADSAARFGGDEFVILLPNTGKVQAVSMVLNLRATLNNRKFKTDQGQLIHVTASYGIATFPDDSKEKIDLMRFADEAMYQAKDEGRDCIKAGRGINTERQEGVLS